MIEHGDLLDAPPPAPGARTRPWRRRLVVLVVVVVVVVLGLAAWFAVRAIQAATALQSAADGVVALRDGIASRELDGLDVVAAGVERDAADAAAATGDPVWRLAEALPVVGADATAVRVAAHAVDTLARDALVPLVGLGDVLDPEALGLVDGRIDVSPLLAAQPVLERAAAATAEVRRSVAGLDPTRLHGPLPDAVADLQRQVATVDDALRTADDLASLAPAMLGSEGPRDYLVLFLNSGEVRAQGGIVGALAVITADDGRIALTAQSSSEEMPRFTEPVVPLTDAERAIASDVVGRRIQNTVILPDTPRVGQIAAEMWRRAHGQTVDGVIAVDTVALSYVLSATGDVRHPQGDVLTADTLVRRLLFSAYAEQDDPTDSDRFFAQAASAAFAAISAGAGDPVDLARALGRAVAERRLSVWSAHPDEQERISGTAADGALLSGGHDDAVGVFLDNTSGWKTDTYLRSEVTLEEARCEGDTVTLELGLELTSTLPADATALPYYVVGDGSTGVPVGSMRMRISVWSPVDGDVVEVRRGETFLGTSGATMAGRDVQVMTEGLGAGQTMHLAFTVRTPLRGAEVPVWTTPTTTTPGRLRLATGCG